MRSMGVPQRSSANTASTSSRRTARHDSAQRTDARGRAQRLPARASGEQPWVRLQRTIGNQAVLRVIQRKPDAASPGAVKDPIVEESFPDYTWHKVGTTNGRGSIPSAVIRSFIAENAGIDRDLLASATVSFHHRNHVIGGTIRPSYFSFRHPTKGVVARAFAELQGFHPERKPDAKVLLKEAHLYDVYVFSRRNGGQPYAFPAPLSSAGPPPTAREPEPRSEKEAEETSTAETIADLGTDLVPWVSNIKDAYIAATGINPVTGEKVGIAGRIISGIFAIPVLGNLLKYIGKGVKGVGKGIKWIGKVIRGKKASEKVATLGLVIRLGGTGLTRELVKEFGKEGVEKLAGALGAELTAQLAREVGAKALKRGVDKYGVDGLKQLTEKLGPAAVKKVLIKEGAEEAAEKGAKEAAEKEATKRAEKEAAEHAAKKGKCYAKYLEQGAYCGATYTDDTLYNLCMANAWTNYIRCLNGLPPLPLVPRK
jgi:hypothetical protein